MSDLLANEKKFLKLNQQLDRIAALSGAATAIVTGTAAAPKMDSRFYTYQKSKGPSTQQKKQGGGDGVNEIANSSTNSREPRPSTTAAANKTNGGATYRSQNRQLPTATSQGQPSHSSNLPQYRPKQSKGSDSSRSQTCYRLANSQVVPAKETTFTVQYRNPKFLESPSLEVLVKEEISSLRCQTDAVCTNSTRSMPIEDNMSTGRRSQSSNYVVSSKKNISSEGLIKFLKSKIIILEEDHERVSHEMSTQKELLDKALEHAKALEQQRDQAKSKNYTLAEQIAKLEKQLDEASKLSKERSVEQNAQQKELETAKREIKLLTQTKTNLDKRLFKANEDLEGARAALTQFKANERREKEAARKDAEIKETQIKNLKKQRANLLNAYKKQLFLIDNLKRQNILLEQAKMLDFGEKEFSKVLDWNIKS